jgi:hypothetical protein
MIPFVSQSMIGQFYRCSEQWRRRWIEKEIIPPGVAARRGTAVHKAAAVNHLQKINSKIDLPLGDLQDATRDEYVRVVKEEGIFIPKDQVSASSKLIGDGLDSAVSLTAVYHRDLAPQIQPIMVEERQVIDVGLSVELQGTLDTVTENQWLVDIKTAAKSKNINEAHNSLQLTFYAGLYYSKYGSWPERLSLEILVATKEPKHQSLETTRDSDDWQDLLIRIKLMLAQIETGLFPPCEPGSWICSPVWCGYFQSCKYANRRSYDRF